MKYISLSALKIGQYIRFDGLGIMSGLKQPRCKADFYVIYSIDESGITLRQFRKRKLRFLPACNFRQYYEIISKSEYNRLPTYCF